MPNVREMSKKMHCASEIISSIQKGIADSNRFEKRDKNSGSNLQGGGSGNNSGYQFPPKGVPNTSHIFGSGGSK